MNKYKILGIFNAVLCIFYTALTIQNGISTNTFNSLEIFLKNHIFTFICFFATVFNGIYAYKLLNKKYSKQISFPLLILFSFYPYIWLGMLFLGYFKATNIGILFFGIAITISLYFFLKKYSIYMFHVLIIATLIVFLYSMYAGFEESYCWNKGAQAEKNGAKFVQASKEDAKSLVAFQVKEGQTIGVGFRTHMLCHDTFTFNDAVQDLFIQK